MGMRILLLLWTGIAVALMLVYAIRPDSFSALTFIPTWAWLALVVPLVPFLRRKYRWPALACGAAWLIFAGWHVEEVRSVVRGALFPAQHQKPAGAIRVVSFNCVCGSADALAEVEAWAPDIVFLQESPSRKAVENFTFKLFGAEGACVWDIDTSIIVKGKLQDLRPKTGIPFYSLVLSVAPNMGEAMLASVRLLSGNPDMNIWSPGYWRRQAKSREFQLQQMSLFAKNLDSSRPMIVAGDFSVPQGDKVFCLLPKTLDDSFAMRGRGVGNTVINDAPLLRFDQIWVSRDFKTIQSFAVKSSISDHRMVISDVRRSR